MPLIAPIDQTESETIRVFSFFPTQQNKFRNKTLAHEIIYM